MSMHPTHADGQTTGPATNDEVSRRRSIRLGEAVRVFLRRPTPWILAVAAVGAAVARLLSGALGWADLVLAGVMVAIFPAVEWVIHVVLLHWRPKRVAGRTLDPLVARKHREHHADPRELDLVFIPLPTLVVAVVATSALGLAGFPLVGLGLDLGLTYLTVQALLGTGYEWTHYLIHTDYRPRTALYRAVWRNHRLHHYKNEHYWFTVTTQGTADRVFGTYPDPSAVETSPTARSLHAEADSMAAAP